MQNFIKPIQYHFFSLSSYIFHLKQQEMALKLSSIATVLLFLSLCQPLLAIREKELWRGTAKVHISNLTADQVWPFLEDYCNLYSVFPVTVSFCVGGVAKNEPGRRRYLVTVVPPANNTNSTETMVRWEQHSLVEMNSIKRFITFEFVDNNENVEMFKSTMHVVKRNQGCEIKWSYIVTPTLGYTNEAVLDDFNWRLRTAAVNMEKAIL
ncbi:hypothetical protein LIER_22644 [Lithospermum erythrorhizon]|uniref:Uncharacterized protein n=1 Tax=Lithospermum erythrorhizon TaxID=34254 RepID=A0AAV3QWX1_LITER